MNKAAILERLKIRPDEFRIISEDLRKDKEFVLKFLDLKDEFCAYFSGIHISLRKDKDIIEKGLDIKFNFIDEQNNMPFNNYTYYKEITAANYNALPNSFKFDTDLTILFLKQNPYIFKYLSKDKKEEALFANLAIQGNAKLASYLFWYFGENLFNDPIFVQSILDLPEFMNIGNRLNINGFFKKISSRLKEDTVFISNLIKKHPALIQFCQKKHLNKELLNDVFSSKENVYLFPSLPSLFRSDKDIINKVLEFDPQMFVCLGQEILRDKEYIDSIIAKYKGKILFSNIPTKYETKELTLFYIEQFNELNHYFIYDLVHRNDIDVFIAYLTKLDEKQIKLFEGRVPEKISCFNNKMSKIIINNNYKVNNIISYYNNLSFLEKIKNNHKISENVFKRKLLDV